jgi:cytochrome c
VSGDTRRSATVVFLPLAIERFHLLVRQRDYFRNPMQTFFRFSLVRRESMRRFAQHAAALLIGCGVVSPAAAQLSGHGGPVRAIAVSADGTRAVSGSFDATVIRWSLASGAAEQVLRFHDGAVNAVVFLRDGRIASSGEDDNIAVWQPGSSKPALVLKGHTAPVASLAISPDGSTLASASWDNTVRLWSLSDHTSRVLEGHQQNVNGVAFMPNGGAVVSSSYDLTLRIWPLRDPAEAPTVVTLPTPLNSVSVTPDGTIVTAGADGKVYFLSPLGEIRGAAEAASVPIIALAVSGDGKWLAASSIRGTVALIDVIDRKPVQTLVGPGLPAWSVAFLPDSQTLLTGGADRLIRRWDARTGQPLGEAAMGHPADPLAAFKDDPGAQVFRACVACHTLKPDEGPRAGPTLSGIFGRRIATQPDYDFSPALKNLDIVWTSETLAKLFELGPAAYTPGTKMPEQRVGADDRAVLIQFLQKATKR